MSWLLVLICIGCSEPGEPILRGSKTTSAPSAPAQPEASEAQQQEVSVRQEAASAHHSSAEEAVVLIKRPLNLSLPAELMAPNPPLTPAQAPLPNLFQRSEDAPGMSLSGRLYWDETEHAEEVPILDSINGAGVEIEIRTP